MDEKILQVLMEIKEELQDIRSTLEPKVINIQNYYKEPSNGETTIVWHYW